MCSQGWPNAEAKHRLVAMFNERSQHYPADNTAFVSHLPEALGRG